MSWSIQYQCDECGEVHETQLYAMECCAPDISVVFVCDGCNQTYKDMDEAEQCCADQDEAAAPPASDGWQRHRGASK